MTITTSTHLNFRGDARAALELYQSVFDGHLVVVTNADGGRLDDSAEADHVMWGQVSSDDGFQIMAFDVPSSQSFARGDRSFFVSVRGESAEEVARYWEGLSDGATIVVDLAASPWSPLYGMLTDRYGITWVLDVAVPYTAG